MTIDPSVSISQGGRNLCTSDWWMRTDYWSDDARLYAPVSGRGWISVGTQRTELRPRSLYFVPPHHYFSFGTGSRMLIDWLHFTPVSMIVDARLAALTSVRQMSSTFIARWRPTYRRIASFMEQPTPALTCRIHALLLEFMSVILEDMAPEEPEVWRARERLMPALDFMDDHDNELPSLTAMAAQVHVSPEHFQRLFSSLFRVTPFAFLRRRQMVKAHRLLSEGALPVKGVAEACGFKDPYYFSRVFRLHYGCTPRAVRRRQVRVGP